MKQLSILVAQLPKPNLKKKKTQFTSFREKKRRVTEEGDFSAHSRRHGRRLFTGFVITARLSVRLFACISAVPTGHFLNI